MIKLYHGTLSNFNQINIRAGKGYKDFGKGFYATSVKRHADSIAKRNRKIATDKDILLCKNKKGRKRVNYTAYRYNLEFDDSCLHNKVLNVKIFNKPDLEWVKFILMNRQCNFTKHNYDIVIGPTADENTVAVINDYIRELHRTNYDNVILQRLLYDLHPENLPKQYFFATEEALKYLQFSNRWRDIIL